MKKVASCALYSAKGKNHPLLKLATLDALRNFFKISREYQE